MPIYNITQIFKAAFGYTPPEAPANDVGDKPQRLEVSRMGQLYYNNVEDDLFGREFFLPVYIDRYLIPFATITMEWKKTIAETAMPERGGSVNELISIDDYTFTIKGVFVDETSNYPEGQIIDLHKKFLQNQSVVLRSVLTDIVLKGKTETDATDPQGHRVIIRAIKWPELNGVEHAKAFEMTLKSDMIFELEIK